MPHSGYRCDLNPTKTETSQTILAKSDPMWVGRDSDGVQLMIPETESLVLKHHQLDLPEMNGVAFRLK